MTPPPEYVTTAELCARLSICRRTVANHGLRAHALQVGSEWRFDWAQVLRHYQARTATGTQTSAEQGHGERAERPVLEASASGEKNNPRGGRANP